MSRVVLGGGHGLMRPLPPPPPGRPRRSWRWLWGPSALKTYSWAVVSFFVIYPIEVAGHLAMYGADGLGHAARAMALGTALACVGKSPAYWLHEHAWSRLRSRCRP